MSREKQQKGYTATIYLRDFSSGSSHQQIPSFRTFLLMVQPVLVNVAACVSEFVRAMKVSPKRMVVWSKMWKVKVLSLDSDQMRCQWAATSQRQSKWMCWPPALWRGWWVAGHCAVCGLSQCDVIPVVSSLGCRQNRCVTEHWSGYAGHSLLRKTLRETLKTSSHINL